VFSFGDLFKAHVFGEGKTHHVGNTIIGKILVLMEEISNNHLIKPCK